MRSSSAKFCAILVCSSCLFAAPQAVEQAWQLAAKGDREQALRLLAQTIQNHPRDAEARLLYGSLLTEAGQAPEALAQLTEAVRLTPHSAEAQNALGEAYHRFGDSPAASQYFQKAVALKPDFAEARLNFGRTLLEAKQLSLAAEQLDRAVALLGSQPEVADALYLRARVCAAQGEFTHTATLLEKATAARPDMAEAWSDLGQARKALLDDSGALTAFERAVQTNPDDPVAQYRLGSQYLQQNRLPPAIEHLRQAMSLNPTDQSTLNSLQIALRRAGKPQDAEQVKQTLAAVLRNRDEADQNALKAVKINNQGAELERTGDLLAASGKYREALSLNPAHVGFRVNYAVALLRLGNWAEGLNQMREALRRDPTNPHIKAALDDALAQAPPLQPK